MHADVVAVVVVVVGTDHNSMFDLPLKNTSLIIDMYKS